MQLPELISDLGYILAVAAVVTLVFKKIGQPVVLGYLLAGILVGPEIDFLPTVKDKNAIKVWAEIGVIVLLFGLGLEFSFRKLAAVGKPATVTALTEVITMLGVGYAIGKLLAWSTLDSLFLGGILAISSTTIIIRAFEELGLKQKKFAGLVFGVLIVEDLVAILLLVILTAIASSSQFQGLALVESVARLGFFLTLWFLAGIFIVPMLLRRAREALTPETTLIFSLALCFVMVILASKSGFSPALGAFVMGSILAETPQGEKIEHIVQPVRDLFAAVFFVSVGMLLDMSVITEHWQTVLIITTATIAGKLLSSAIGALISGQDLKTSVSAGLSLAQIGEFSFIIATLGLTLKVTSDFLYPIAVAVSVLTTFTTPYLIRSAPAVHRFLEQRLPQGFVHRVNQASISSLTLDAQSGTAKSGVVLFLNSVVVIGITLASANFFQPFVLRYSDNPMLASLLSMLLALVGAFPFLWAIVMHKKQWQLIGVGREQISILASRTALSLFGRVFLALALLAFILNVFTQGKTAFLVSAAVIVLVGLLGFKNFGLIYNRIEQQFLKHLNEKDRARVERQNEIPPLAPWDAHLAEFVVHPDSRVVGQSLISLRLRETLGVSVAMIERGTQSIVAPRRDEMLMPFDKIHVIGTEEQLTALADLLQDAERGQGSDESHHYGLRNVLITTDSPYFGRTIRDSRIREDTGGIVVGVERNGTRILNPDSETILQDNDRIWIVGDLRLISERMLGS